MFLSSEILELNLFIRVGKIRVFAYIPQAQRLMIASWQKQVNFVRPIIFLFLQRFLAKKKIHLRSSLQFSKCVGLCVQGVKQSRCGG